LLNESAHHRFFPPKTATGIPLKIKSAPNVPYAGSMTMLKGTQPSVSFQATVVFDTVPFVSVPFVVPLVVFVVVPFE
jgi:hypothetical protein